MSTGWMQDCGSLLMHQQLSLLTHGLNLASLTALDSHETSPASTECSRSVTRAEDIFIRRKWKYSIGFRSETVSTVLTQQWWNSHSGDSVATLSTMFMWRLGKKNREEVQHSAHSVDFGTMSCKHLWEKHLFLYINRLKTIRWPSFSLHGLSYTALNGFKGR